MFYSENVEWKKFTVNNQTYSQEHDLQPRFMISLSSPYKIISMELKMAEIALVITALYLYNCKLILEFHLVYLINHDCLGLSGCP